MARNLPGSAFQECVSGSKKESIEGVILNATSFVSPGASEIF